MFGFGIYKKKEIEIDRKLLGSNEVVIKRMQNEIIRLEEEAELLNYIKKIKYESVINVVENKHMLFLVTKRESDNNVTIAMKNPNIREYPEVFLGLDKEGNYEQLNGIGSPNKKILIEDINAINKRQGNGRILIEAVISYAEEHQYRKIYGRITSDDKRSTPGLPNFYRKMGFVVNEDESYFEMKL